MTTQQTADAGYQFNSPSDRHARESIRILMALTGTSQIDLANELGIAQSSLSERLRGKRGWLVSEIDQLAMFFDCDSFDILAGTTPRPGPQSRRQPTIAYVDPQRLRLVPDAHGSAKRVAA